jgi:hypothetical protein
MATRIHRTIKVIALNANDVARQLYELKLSLYGTDRYPGRKGGTAVAVRKDIHLNHVHLPPLVSVEAYLLVIAKYCLYVFTNLWAVPGLMLTSLSS